MFSIGRFRSFTACAIIFSMLVVATAPAWHRHDDDSQAAAPCGQEYRSGHDQPGDRRHPDQDRHDHHNCSICVAIHTPTGSGLPGGVAIVLALIQVGLAQALRYDEPVVRFPPVFWSRGPPSSLA